MEARTKEKSAPGNQELIPTENINGVFIGNSRDIANKLASIFDTKSFTTRVAIAADDPKILRDQLGDIIPSNVKVVITDQYRDFDRPKLRKEVRIFLNKLSPDTLVVETGGLADKPVYDKKNKVSPLTELFGIVQTIDATDLTSSERVTALKDSI